ncbi:mitochondrial chaperone bcs1 [Colletotrichum karsti]|uniref:Mitochondrial chaperone bcs1 n=1 Tax=Colletotrichum karsti TaxID=1095194 RepID=A0A9P6LPG2_9PEZI|nr:mitochondrial chaperone bcs1 [Colletotrichum karsti]KAF9880830.1 mitochondrial chaperone bcs1 [Colletotrichum karsti]
MGTISQYLGFDLNLYIPLFLVLGLTGVGRYLIDEIKYLFNTYLMAEAGVFPDDEIYNILMSWVANQSFASKSRHFIANLNRVQESSLFQPSGQDHSKPRSQSLKYTPSFGTHLFWYKNRPIFFRRTKIHKDLGPRIKAEEITLRCFGYSPSLLKDLLKDAHEEYMKIHENKTMVYSAEQRRFGAEWNCCMALEPRHFSTIITRPGLKESIIDDITDYLSAETQLPQECIVLFEDIDAAGLTSTRAAAGPDEKRKFSSASDNDRLSLSGLLNLLDGVAIQEGRILIMSTNHAENLDKALIRPGRVDMIIQFTLADSHMLSNIFQTVFASTSTQDKPEKNTPVDQRPRVVSSEIKALSEQFAARIPSGEFSPAEIQGYLIRYKRKPEMAVSGAEDWFQTTRSEKAAQKSDEVSKTEEESDAKLPEKASGKEKSGTES